MAAALSAIVAKPASIEMFRFIESSIAAMVE